MKTFDEGGKGRKQCPGCQKYVAAPAAKCVCGHVFYEKKPKAESEDIATRPAQAIDSTRNHANLRRVSIPGSTPGSKEPFCPAKPKGEWPHTEVEIEQWVKDVIDGGKARGLLYAADAVRYFVEGFWPSYHSGIKKGVCPEHTRACLLAFQYAVEEHKLAAWYRRQDREFEDDAPEGI